jgi:hypothetical protein
MLQLPDLNFTAGPSFFAETLLAMQPAPHLTGLINHILGQLGDLGFVCLHLRTEVSLFLIVQRNATAQTAVCYCHTASDTKDMRVCVPCKLSLLAL